MSCQVENWLMYMFLIPVTPGTHPLTGTILRNKISREQFYKSYEYYLYHTDEMKIMLDTLQVRQQKIIDSKNDTLIKNWTRKKFFLNYYNE